MWKLVIGVAIFLVFVSCGNPEETPAEDDAFRAISLVASTRQILADLLLDAHIAMRAVVALPNLEGDGCAQVLVELDDLFLDVHEELRGIQELDLAMFLSYVAHDWGEFAQHEKAAENYVKTAIEQNARVGLLASRAEEHCLP